MSACNTLNWWVIFHLAKCHWHWMKIQNIAHDYLLSLQCYNLHTIKYESEISNSGKIHSSPRQVWWKVRAADWVIRLRPNIRTRRVGTFEATGCRYHLEPAGCFELKTLQSAFVCRTSTVPLIRIVRYRFWVPLTSACILNLRNISVGYVNCIHYAPLLGRGVFWIVSKKM